MDKLKTLSQAIRLGATFRPQCKASYFDNGRSCAVGAAYEAVTGLSDALDGMVGKILNERFSLPDELLSRIVYWNDLGENREKIADHLEENGL